MTTHQDSSSELRGKLLQYNRDIYAHALLMALAGHLGKDISPTAGVDAAEEFLPKLEALIAQDRQELLKRIELPEKYVIQDALVKGAINYSQVGWNNALEAVQAIINAIRESI